MANASNTSKEQFKKDVLTLDTAAVMKKYRLNKQAVYDKRYALKKKKAQLEFTTKKSQPVMIPKKRGRKPVIKGESPALTNTPVENIYTSPAVIPTIKSEISSRTFDKSVQFSFDKFSIKLNNMPQKISVNPETNAIEIDL